MDLSVQSETCQCNVFKAIAKSNAARSPLQSSPLPLTSAGTWKVADCWPCGSPDSKTYTPPSFSSSGGAGQGASRFQ